MAPWLPLGIGMKSLDPLSEPTLVQWVLGSSCCTTMPGFMWREFSQFLEDEEIDTIEWLPRSPDLNPTEHLWDIMFRSIQWQQVAPQSVKELSDTLVQIWEEIPQDIILRLIRSMPRRCQACIQALGGHIKLLSTRAGLYISCDSHAHLVSKAGSLISG